jgi:hypothetical protein
MVQRKRASVPDVLRGTLAHAMAVFNIPNVRATVLFHIKLVASASSLSLRVTTNIYSLGHLLAQDINDPVIAVNPEPHSGLDQGGCFLSAGNAR